MSGSETNTLQTPWLRRCVVVFHPQHFASTVIEVLVLKVSTESRRLHDNGRRSHCCTFVHTSWEFHIHVISDSRLFLSAATDETAAQHRRRMSTQFSGLHQEREFHFPINEGWEFIHSFIHLSKNWWVA